LGNYYHQQFIF